MTEENKKEIEPIAIDSKLKEEKDLGKLHKVVMMQKQEIHRQAMKVNQMERQLMGAMEKIDSLAGSLIVMVQKYGKDDKVEITKEELCNVMPGTVIDDSNQDEFKVCLRVIEVEELKKEIHAKAAIQREIDKAKYEEAKAEAKAKEPAMQLVQESKE